MLINPDVLPTILEKGNSKRVIVCGDLILDVWLNGETTRISPEAPVPIVRLKDKSIAPGGAANLAMNLRRMGADVALCGIVGEDEEGFLLREILATEKIDLYGVVRDYSRTTITKTRVVSHNQQMLRIDSELDTPFEDAAKKLLLSNFQAMVGDCQLICFSDYAKGVINLFENFAPPEGKIVTAGLKPENIETLAGCNLLSFNLVEANILGEKKFTEESITAFCHSICRKSNSANVAITRGEKDVILCGADGIPECFPVHPVEVFDVTGAGDTFLAATSFGMLARVPLRDCIAFGNVMAAAAVRRHRVVALTKEEILDEIARL